MPVTNNEALQVHDPDDDAMEQGGGEPTAGVALEPIPETPNGGGVGAACSAAAGRLPSLHGIPFPA